MVRPAVPAPCGCGGTAPAPWWIDARRAEAFTTRTSGCTPNLGVPDEVSNKAAAAAPSLMPLELPARPCRPRNAGPQPGRAVPG